MGTLAQSSPTMQGLLVLASLTVISAQILPYGGLGYPYGYSGLGLGYGGLGLPYTYGANIVKPVAKEIEVPVTTIKLEAAENGCANSFGNPVPCLQEGEARKKREADDEAEAEAAPTVTEVEVPQYKLVPQEKVVEVAPACQNAWGFPVPCLRKKRDADDEAEAAPAAPILPLGYAGLGYAGLGYAGLGYAGVGYHGLGYGLPLTTIPSLDAT